MPHGNFREKLADFLQDKARPKDKFGHQPRLYALTKLAGQGQSYDDDIVYAAAYLHDLGVFIGQRPEDPEALAHWDHVAYAVEQTPSILQAVMFPPEKIDAVLAAIRTHQPRDTPETMEAVILRDADILEQLGAIGILRAVAKTGRDTRYATFTPVIAFLERSLAELPAAIRLPATRALAEPKIAMLQAFLKAVQTEAQDALY